MIACASAGRRVGKPSERASPTPIVPAAAINAVGFAFKDYDQVWAAMDGPVGAFVRNNPEVPVFVAGDGKASYETVYAAMVLLQSAGVPKVGLMSQPAEAASR